MEVLAKLERVEATLRTFTSGAQSTHRLDARSRCAKNAMRMARNAGFAREMALESAVMKAALSACDTLDGVTDGLIENPLVCAFNPKVLQCAGGAIYCAWQYI